MVDLLTYATIDAYCSGVECAIIHRRRFGFNSMIRKVRESAADALNCTYVDTLDAFAAGAIDAALLMTAQGDPADAIRRMSE